MKTMANPLFKTAFLAIGMALLPFYASAVSVTFTDLGSGQYGVTLDPIVFTVGSNQSAANRMVIEDFYTTGATGQGTHISGSINWSRNGGAPVAISFETNNGNFNGTSGQVDPNDLLFNFTIAYTGSGGTSLNAGDTVTLSTSNMIFSTPGTRLALPGPYTAYLLNGVNAISSESVTLSSAAVPDGGSTVALLGMALSGMALLRRKFCKSV
jgi:hypothetical protein